MAKNMECLEAGKVTNIKRILMTPTECSKCKKPYDVKNKNLIFQRCNDGTIDMWCDKCYEKHLKAWDLKDITEFISDAMGYYSGVAKCIMTDGRQMNFHYGLNNPVNEGIPQEFVDKFEKIKREHEERKDAVRIKSIETVDTFDVQKIIVTQNNSKVTELKYKMGLKGMIFNEFDVAKVDKALMQNIIQELQLKGISLN